MTPTRRSGTFSNGTGAAGADASGGGTAATGRAGKVFGSGVARVGSTDGFAGLAGILSAGGIARGAGGGGVNCGSSGVWGTGDLFADTAGTSVGGDVDFCAVPVWNLS